MIQHLLAITIAVTSCQAQAPASAAKTRSEPVVVELRFDQPAHHRDLEIQWLEVNDSRCPTGTQCVWQGEVKIEIEAVHPSAGSIQLELTLTPGRPTAAKDLFGEQVRLASLDPHPKTGVDVERSQYRAVVEITETAEP